MIRALLAIAVLYVLFALLCLWMVTDSWGASGADSTAYCLRGTMADGTYTRHRSVAMNRHPLGTRIYVLGRGGPNGLRRFIVRDRIGYGSEMDFWRPSCSLARAWGRRNVSYKIGWARP